MPEAEQFAPTEQGAQESEALEGQTVATDTAEPVAETDEQKNQRELAERQKRSERASRGIQKRFDELTAEKHAAHRQVEQLTELMKTVLGGQQRPAQASPQNAEPQRGTDESYEDWVARRAEWRAEQRASKLFDDRMSALQKQAEQQRQAQQVGQVRSQFEQRAQEFAKSNPEFAEAAANDDVRVSDAAAGLIQYDPDGPAMILALHRNPALAAQLQSENPIQAAMAVGMLKAALKSSPQISKAPAPGRPVGSRGGAIDNGPSDSDSMESWLKKRQAQIKSR